MTQVATGLNAYMAYGNENPNGWHKGRLGALYIDNLANIYYRYVSDYVWENLGAIDYSLLKNKPILFSGNYADLAGKPSLFSGSYNDLSNKPILFSGNYADLINTPDLSIYVQKIAGKGLSTNDYTNDDKNKLAGLNINYPVTSVNSKIGDVILNKNDISLNNVDNTSDLSKPISTAVQTALNNKVDKIIGKSLSTEDYTTAEKTKLAGLTKLTNVNFSAPVARTISKGVAYQATDNTKSATFNLSLTATSSVSLTGSSPNSGVIVIGTNATQVALGNGTIVGRYNNSQTIGLSVSLVLNNTQSNGYTFNLPPGYYFSVVQTTGTGITIDNVTEQTLVLA